MNATQETNNGIFTGERGNPIEHIADYHFGVREEQMVTVDGIEIPNQRAIIRCDTNTVVGTVGGNYKVLSHERALDPILDHLTSKGVSTFKRIALTANGARMFANIYFPSEEFAMPNGVGAKVDACWPGMTVVNSLDGSLKYQTELTIYRLLCTNGMKVSTVVSQMSTPHSKNKSYDEVVEEILAQIGGGDRVTTIQRWANKRMTKDEMEESAVEIVKGTIFPAKYLKDVDREIDREVRNGVSSVWGLYNAFNSVLEHGLIRTNGRFERARLLDDNLFRTFERTFK